MTPISGRAGSSSTLLHHIFMMEERDGIYKNSSIQPVIIGFLVVILAALILGWFFLRTGHPAMHTNPQPLNNKGALYVPSAARNA